MVKLFQDLAIMIIAYYPEINLFIPKVNKFATYCNVIIFNNGGLYDGLLKSQLNTNRVQVLGKGENKGIGTAVNRMVEFAKQSNFKMFLVLDQDSSIDEHSVRTMYKELIKREKVIICPNILSLNGLNETNALYLKRNRSSLSKSPIRKDLERVYITITSGMLIKIKDFDLIGRYNEKLFIEGIDDDFYIRSNLKKYQTMICKNAILYQNYGNELKEYNFFGVKFYPTNHNHDRRFYIFRNKILIIKQYRKNAPEYVRFQILSLLKIFIGILLFEKQKLMKLVFSLKGLVTGLLKKKKNFFN